jgi:hypothetical protein
MTPRRTHGRLAALLAGLGLALVALAVAWRDPGPGLVAACALLGSAEQLLLSRGVQLW